MIAREVYLQTAVIAFMYLKLIFTSPLICTRRTQRKVVFTTLVRFSSNFDHIKPWTTPFNTFTPTHFAEALRFKKQVTLVSLNLPRFTRRYSSESYDTLREFLAVKMIQEVLPFEIMMRQQFRKQENFHFLRPCMRNTTLSKGISPKVI